MSAESSGKISLALGGAKPLSAPPVTNGVKRSSAALHDHDEEESTHGKTEAVSRFDRSAGGAIDDSRPTQAEKPLVIKPRANRDWKQASQSNKRPRSAKLPQRPEDSLNSNAESQLTREDNKPLYGLNVPKRSAQDEDATMNGHASDGNNDTRTASPCKVNGDAAVREKTDDERAIDALLGKEEKTELVLPALTEEEAFVRDYKDAPDMATLEDYERVPVEQFGAALLRGMGWKEGEGIGSQRGKKIEKTKLPERRPALLGIGAKEEAAVAQEMGTWGRAAKDKKGPQQVYNPVLLRDKRTGELFTEEELEKKKQHDERAKYEMEFDREEKRKEKERRRKDRDASRDRDHERRHRRRDATDDRHRREYDSDEDYYRRKEKEKRRREHERGRGGSDHDRERSRRHDSDRERHRPRRSDDRR